MCMCICVCVCVNSGVRLCMCVTLCMHVSVSDEMCMSTNLAGKSRLMTRASKSIPFIEQLLSRYVEKSVYVCQR